MASTTVEAIFHLNISKYIRYIQTKRFKFYSLCPINFSTNTKLHTSTKIATDQIKLSNDDS